MQMVQEPQLGRPWSLGSQWQQVDFRITNPPSSKKPACSRQGRWPGCRLTVTVTHSPVSHVSGLEPRETELRGLHWSSRNVHCATNAPTLRQINVVRAHAHLGLSAKGQGHGYASSSYGGNFVLNENILDSSTWYRGKELKFKSRRWVAMWLWVCCLNLLGCKIISTIASSNSSWDVCMSSFWDMGWMR